MSVSGSRGPRWDPPVTPVSASLGSCDFPPLLGAHLARVGCGERVVWWGMTQLRAARGRTVLESSGGLTQGGTLVHPVSPRAPVYRLGRDLGLYPTGFVTVLLGHPLSVVTGPPCSAVFTLLEK